MIQHKPWLRDHSLVDFQLTKEQEIIWQGTNVISFNIFLFCYKFLQLFLAATFSIKEKKSVSMSLGFFLLIFMINK